MSRVDAQLAKMAQTGGSAIGEVMQVGRGRPGYLGGAGSSVLRRKGGLQQVSALFVRP